MLNLPESLKLQTRALHTELERSATMHALLRGQMAPAAYCELLRNLHTVYSALEPALQQHAARPAVAAVYFPDLFRCRALADDLNVLHGPDWPVAIAPRPSAMRFAEHLAALRAARPDLLVAHAYVRYLGDLSGGQVLRRIVAATLGRDDGLGTSFYDFGSPVDVATRVRAYREGLARVTDDAALVADIVAEAVFSFQLHQRLFDELATAAGGPLPAASLTVAS